MLLGVKIEDPSKSACPDTIWPSLLGVGTLVSAGQRPECGFWSLHPGLVNKETSLVQSEAAVAAPRGHLNHLDGMRALAAIYVVLHHAFLQSWPNIDVAAIRSNPKFWPLFPLAFGHSAVTAFIAISGFSLALPIVRGNGFLKPDFFKRQYPRCVTPATTRDELPRPAGATRAPPPPCWPDTLR